MVISVLVWEVVVDVTWTHAFVKSSVDSLLWTAAFKAEL